MGMPPTMQVTVLGSGSGGPFQGRNFTSHLLQIDQQLFLIDCGEGTQHQLFRYRVKYDDVKEIFITHLHGDHIFGLMGLLTSFCLKRRTAPLLIFGPEGIREYVETCSRLTGVMYPFDLSIQEVDATRSALVFSNHLVEVYSIPLVHRTLCTGWLFKEKPRLRNILSDKITEFGIPFSKIPGIKKGDDLILADGRIIPNTSLTTAPIAPRSFAFCSDTAPNPDMIPMIQGVDLLYHEATFTDEYEDQAALSVHSTASQAAQIAKDADVGQLLLGHFSGRYKDADQHLKEASSIFHNTLVAEEGQKYPIGLQL